MTRGRIALLSGITAAGALLRLWSPGRIALWSDEVQFLGIASMRHARDILAFLAGHESHPPLTYLAAWALHEPATQLASTLSVVALALSVAAVPAAWWVASRSGSGTASAIAAALVATSVPAAFTSVQVRPYGLISLLLLLSAGMIVMELQVRRRMWRVSWAACALLLLYSHHIAVLIVLAELAAVVLAGIADGEVRGAIRRWLPVWMVVTLLAIPDLLLLRHQEALTGYLPVPSALSAAPLRQFLRLAITFPGELLIPGCLSAMGLFAAWRTRTPEGRSDALGTVTGLVSALFLLICAFLVTAGLRQNVLTDHVVVPIAPLGQVAAGLALALAWRTSRPLFAGSILLMVAGVTLSVLFTIGAVKTNIDLVAARISAEARPADLILLVPGTPGIAFGRYFRPANTRIDYPLAGPARLNEFDHGFARMADTTALRRTTEAIVAARARKQRVWFIYPAGWNVKLPAVSVVLPDSVGVLKAARLRAAQLHQRLVATFGDPGLRVRPATAPWSMELMAVERFGP